MADGHGRGSGPSAGGAAPETLLSKGPDWQHLPRPGLFERYYRQVTGQSNRTLHETSSNTVKSYDTASKTLQP